MSGADLRDDALQPSAMEMALVWFYRVVALICLVLGVTYWVRLIGLHDGADWRFDLMPYYWQAASASLAVLYPIAAIGLWMTASWGPVLWLVCAAAEVIMYVAFEELFGTHYGILAAHLLIAAVYCALRAGIHMQRRRAD
jgi:hypothetical protein